MWPHYVLRWVCVFIYLRVFIKYEDNITIIINNCIPDRYPVTTRHTILITDRQMFVICIGTK